MTFAAALPERWRQLPARLRLAGAIGVLLVLYVLVWAVTGQNGWLHTHAPIGDLLVGVVYGSVNALGAMGLILVYRANRFINFAHGAMGSVVGVLTIGLVKVHGLNYWIALPLAVIVGGFLGALIEVLVIRRFATAPRLIVLIASVGLAQELGGLELIGSKHEGFGSFTGAFSPPFNVSVTIDVYTFHSAEILAVAAVPAVLAFLAWFLLRTDAGIAIRAAAENSDRALLLGVPVRRLATIVWTIAGALAVLTYMLSAPFEGVKPGVASNGPTVLVPMLAVAIVARMESLPVAFGAGIALGMMEAVVRWNTTGDPALIWPIYMAVIIAALLAQSGKLSRAQVSGISTWSSIKVLKPVPEELRRLPEVVVGKWALFLAVAAAFVLVPWAWGPSNQYLAATAIVWAILGVSLVVLTGWSGQISLGQFGIAGVAALIAGNMVAHWNADFLFVILASAATGGITALVVGLPALRIRGLFLAVTTLAVAVALDQYFLNETTFPSWIPLNGVPRPVLLQRFNLNDNYTLYLVCLFFLAVSILVTRGMRRSRAGRVLIATNDNERAAASVSVNTTAVRLAGFATAGVIAGIAGALDVYILSALSPGSFPPVDSITVFGYSVIGGLGSITGVLSGVLAFKFLESITAFGQFHLVISGTALLVVLQVIPGGFGQVLYDLRDRILRMVASRRGILVPTLVADRRTAGVTTEREPDLLTSIASGEVDGSLGTGDDDTAVLEVRP